MSRTWRQVPKEACEEQPTPRNTGGAVASTGPSPERRRPDTDYDNEILHLAVDMLEQTVGQLKNPQPRSASAPAEARPADVNRLLWQTAFHGDCPPELLLPALGLAQEAVNQTSAAHARPTADTFRKAAADLQATANAKSDNEAVRYGNEMLPDGRQRDSAIKFWRDYHVTGLRDADHRRARREARRGLANPESAETVRAGKNRRYSDQYGNYDL